MADVTYEILEHAVDLPRAGVSARRLARFEREFARWLVTDAGRHAERRARRALDGSGTRGDDVVQRRRTS
jgi:hypothetical protein